MPDRQIFFDPRTQALEAPAPHSGCDGRGVHAGRRRLHLQCAAQPAPAGAAAAHSQAQLRALPEPSILSRNAKNQRPARRKTARKPSEIPLNTGEGLRAAYYVQDDAASYSSLKEHVHQIDMLFPQWLHVDSPNGTLMMMSGDNLREYPVIEGATVHDPDDLNKVKHVIQAAQEDTEIFPALNNFNPHTQDWDTGVGDVLKDPDKSAALLQQIMRFLASLPGLSRPFARH